MKINYVDGKIELTKAEMKAAGNYGSAMYKKLMCAKRDNPDFVVVEIAPKRNNDSFSDLTMKTIRAYVEAHGNEQQKEHFAFISKRSVDNDGEYVEAQSFFKIKEWFLNSFPEFKLSRKQYREQIIQIYKAAEETFEEAEKKAAAQKKAAADEKKAALVKNAFVENDNTNQLLAG